MTEVTKLIADIESFLAKTKGTDDFRMKSRRQIMRNRIKLLGDNPSEKLIADTIKDIADVESYAADPAEWLRKSHEHD